MDVTKIKTLGIPMPEDMAEEFERLCKGRGQTMSAVIKMLVWDWIQEQKNTKKAEGE